MTKFKFSAIITLCFIPFYTLTGQASAGLITSLSLDDDHKALANEHPYVGWDFGLDANGDIQSRASVVLINPNWVLMSAHQALSIDTDQSSRYDSFQVGFGSNYNSNPGENMFTNEVYIHPSFQEVGSGYDLALLYFENPFTSVAPIDRFYGDVAVGDQGNNVGYGALQVVGGPDQGRTGDRRAGTDLVRDVDFLGQPNFRIRLDNQYGGPSSNLLQMAITHGDSGGGWIIGDELAGIASASSFLGNYGDISIFYKLDNEWIDSTIASRASAVPEPSSFILLSTLLPIFGLVKRRRKLPTETVADKNG